jgi:hypothetical protein
MNQPETVSHTPLDPPLNELELSMFAGDEEMWERLDEEERARRDSPWMGN